MTTLDLLKFTVTLKSGREETWYLSPDVELASLYKCGELMIAVALEMRDHDGGDSPPEDLGSAPPPAEAPALPDETPPKVQLESDGVSSKPKSPTRLIGEPADPPKPKRSRSRKKRT